MSQDIPTRRLTDPIHGNYTVTTAAQGSYGIIHIEDRVHFQMGHPVEEHVRVQISHDRDSKPEIDVKLLNGRLESPHKASMLQAMASGALNAAVSDALLLHAAAPVDEISQIAALATWLAPTATPPVNRAPVAQRQ